MDNKELEALNLLHYSTVNENEAVLSAPFPAVHNHLLCLDHIDQLVVVLAPHFQVSGLLPISCLVVVCDQAYSTTFVCSGNLNDCVGVMLDHALMGVQGVLEGTKQAPLWGPCVEDQHGTF